jgi:hypothetical protein
MPQTMTRPATGRTNGAKGDAKAAPRPRPFVAGSREIDKPVYDNTRTLTAGSQTLPTYEVEPSGYLRGLFLVVESTGSNGGAANVALTADAPWNVLDVVNFVDVNSKPLTGPFTGYDLYIAVKYGGYAFQDDAKMSPAFTAPVTGTGATAGTFAWVLWLPVEFIKRDARGALTNKSSSSTFALQLTLAASATVFTVAPSAGASIRVRIQQASWQDPQASDTKGQPVAQDPPGIDTTQYWAKQTMVLSSGALNQRLQGIDSFVRCLIIVARDENGARQQADGEFPDPFTLQYETAIIVQRLLIVWRHMIARMYGYTAAVETAGGRDYGVYPLPFNQDFYGKPGYETALGYLPVSSATTLIMSGTIGGTGANQYALLVNKIVPAQGDPKALTGGL